MASENTSTDKTKYLSQNTVIIGYTTTPDSYFRVPQPTGSAPVGVCPITTAMEQTDCEPNATTPGAKSQATAASSGPSSTALSGLSGLSAVSVNTERSNLTNCNAPLSAASGTVQKSYLSGAQPQSAASAASAATTTSGAASTTQKSVQPTSAASKNTMTTLRKGKTGMFDGLESSKTENESTHLQSTAKSGTTNNEAPKSLPTTTVLIKPAPIAAPALASIPTPHKQVEDTHYSLVMGSTPKTGETVIKPVTQKPPVSEDSCLKTIKDGGAPHPTTVQHIPAAKPPALVPISPPPPAKLPIAAPSAVPACAPHPTVSHGQSAMPVKALTPPPAKPHVAGHVSPMAPVVPVAPGSQYCNTPTSPAKPHSVYFAPEANNQKVVSMYLPAVPQPAAPRAPAGPVPGVPFKPVSTAPVAAPMLPPKTVTPPVATPTYFAKPTPTTPPGKKSEISEGYEGLYENMTVLRRFEPGKPQQTAPPPAPPTSTTK